MESFLFFPFFSVGRERAGNYYYISPCHELVTQLLVLSLLKRENFMAAKKSQKRCFVEINQRIQTVTLKEIRKTNITFSIASFKPLEQIL